MLNFIKGTVLAVLFVFVLPLMAASLCENQLGAESERLNLARSETWLRLLHYRRNLLRFGSQADGPAFFIAPNGARDPQAELRSFIHELCAGTARETGSSTFPKLPARCQFPARERFLLDN